ncbi:hypothetical protein BDP27DRAFT_1188690, partial [Rhodocollybia butyracea]
VINAMYNHCNSQPSWNSPRVHECNTAFSFTKEPTSIGYAWPSLKARAAQICATQAHINITTLTQNNLNHSEYTPAILSHNNVSWSDILSFSPEQSIYTFKQHPVFLYNFWEHISVPWKDGQPVQCIIRPPMHILASLTPIFNGHNMHVNGYMSLAFGIQLFNCQAHTDLKHLMSRMGLAVHDTTVRKVIASMTEKDHVQMQTAAAMAAEDDTVVKFLAIDNCQ